MSKEHHRSQAECAKDGKPFEVQITQQVSPLMIGYAICGAFEGGSNYWLRSAQLIRSDFPKEPGLVWYGADHMFDGDFEFEVTFDDPGKDEGNGEGVKRITRADVIKGLQLMAVKRPADFADLVDVEGSNADANTYDAFMQYVVLGEEVYG